MSRALGKDPLSQIWRDTGLYDEFQPPRPAFDTREAERAKPPE